MFGRDHEERADYKEQGLKQRWYEEEKGNKTIRAQRYGEWEDRVEQWEQERIGSESFENYN